VPLPLKERNTRAIQIGAGHLLGSTHRDFVRAVETAAAGVERDEEVEPAVPFDDVGRFDGVRRRTAVGDAEWFGRRVRAELSQLGRLGAQLILQRAVEDEMAAFLGRARYERAPEAAGSRNGHRPRRIQTAEGEITIAMTQVRDTFTRFVSSVIPDTRAIVRTRPLEARRAVSWTLRS
jgi:hypothetical protein